MKKKIQIIKKRNKMKYIFLILISINILLGNEVENKTVKASELELFLFKIGFQSLLKDVDITKNKSNLNEQELKKLNSKIEIIMNEIYKDKRVLNNDSSVSFNENKNNQIVSSKEIEYLKTEIEKLKKQVNTLSKKEQVNKVILKSKTKKMNFKAFVKINKVNLRDKPLPSGNIVAVLDINTEIEIERCNAYSWCKLKGEEKYIARYLITKL